MLSKTLKILPSISLNFILNTSPNVDNLFNQEDPTYL